jgi:hypothetical protein
MSTCSSCGAAILWTQTSTGRAMPVDAEPSEKGNIYLQREPGPPIIAIYVSNKVPHDFKPLYLSHFATCPDAKKHRRKP